MHKMSNVAALMMDGNVIRCIWCCPCLTLWVHVKVETIAIKTHRKLWCFHLINDISHSTWWLEHCKFNIPVKTDCNMMSIRHAHKSVFQVLRRCGTNSIFQLTEIRLLTAKQYQITAVSECKSKCNLQLVGNFTRLT